MLSAIGGTMGLLTGFSIISGVEIVYFAVKGVWNSLNKRYWLILYYITFKFFSINYDDIYRLFKLTAFWMYVFVWISWWNAMQHLLHHHWVWISINWWSPIICYPIPQPQARDDKFKQEVSQQPVVNLLCSIKLWSSCSIRHQSM